MNLASLNVRSFRNYAQPYRLELSPTVTLIVGNNGSGKTNLLEAAYFLATAHSSRVRYDSQLINWDSDVAWIGGELQSKEETVRLDLSLAKREIGSNLTTKRYLVNQVGKKAKDFLDRFTAVLFTPEDIKLVLGSPNRRREFLDEVLKQKNQVYTYHCNQYQKALRQKSRLLKLIRAGEQSAEQLDFWNDLLLTNGKVINQQRQNFFDFCAQTLPLVNKQIFDQSELRLGYYPKTISRENLEKYAQAEAASGNCLIGPHRDDFTFWLDSRDLAFFGSRGLQRLATLALKIVEYEFLSRDATTPLLLLDDIFSELDSHRQKLVLSLAERGQTVIATTHQELVPEEYQRKWKVVTINTPIIE